MLQGVSKILGVEFNKNYTSVLNKIFFCTIILMWYINKENSNIINIEGSLLYEDLDDKFFIDLPQVII